MKLCGTWHSAYNRAKQKPYIQVYMLTIRPPLLLCVLLLGGCASSNYHNPKDPLESFNRSMYTFNDTVDKAVLKPAAKAYNVVVPPPGRMMISNFFSNLDDVLVTANDLLQLKVKQALSDAGRIVVNSTVGLLGLVDVASHVGMDKHDEDFGQTLGYWGVGSGAYLVLPFLGPSSVRDGIGLYADSRISPLQKVNNVPARNEAYATEAVSLRSNLLSKEKLLEEAAIDRYSFIRDAYLQRRKSLVYDGNPPREKRYDDEEYDDEENRHDSAPKSSSPEDKGSSNEENAPPAAATESAVDAPVAAATPDEPHTAVQTARVYRIWVGQREGFR
jgi:phospholipid-binding lipoprotein MlaA